MNRVLCLKSHPAHELVQDLLEGEVRDHADVRVVVDLTATEIDYDRLLDEILKADSIQTW